MLEFQWTDAPAAPRAGGNAAVVAWRGRILVLGGQGPTDEVSALDPVTGAWTSLPRMPEARSSHGAAVLGDRVYVFGGFGADGRELDTVSVYDGDRWATAGTMPVARARFGITEHEGGAFLIGGLLGKESLARVDRFHPQQGWTRKADLPQAVNRLEATAGLMVAGGEDAQGNGLTRVLRLDGERWVDLPPMGTARRNFALVRLGANVVAAGGWDQVGDARVFPAHAELFDGAQWTSLPDLSIPRDGVKAAAINGSVWLLGGYDGQPRDTVTRGSWRSTTSDWRIDGDLRFHLATLGEWEGPPVPSLGFEPDALPDITNIPLAGLQGLGFPVSPENPEGRTFYLKFFRYPEGLDPALSARLVLEPTLAFQMGEGEALRRFVAGGGHVVVKKGLVGFTRHPFGAEDPFPPLRAGTQADLDGNVLFSSLYVQPAGAGGSADGVLAFHRELLELYRASFGPPEDLGGHWRFGNLRVPKEPLVFEDYSDLPMPQDPQRMFLTGLLLVYEDLPRPRVLEVGSVIRLPVAFRGRTGSGWGARGAT